MHKDIFLLICVPILCEYCASSSFLFFPLYSYWHFLSSVLFRATDCEVSVPVPNNHLMCDQCFCYICDKLASSVCGDLPSEIVKYIQNDLKLKVFLHLLLKEKCLTAALMLSCLCVCVCSVSGGVTAVCVTATATRRVNFGTTTETVRCWEDWRLLTSLCLK